MKRTDAPQLVWPAALERPANRRPLVYLDLNHWISLAQAATGHKQGERFAGTLAACQSAVQLDRATFVLSHSHYIELLKIRSPRQRSDVGTVMELLSRFKTLLSRANVMELELAAALDRQLDLVSHEPPRPLVGFGVMHALGRPPARFRIRHRETGKDATAIVRQDVGPEKFDAHMADALLRLERGALFGPKDDEECRALSRFGYNPDAPLRVADARANEEAAQRLRLDGGGPWRHDRLEDVITARELLIEFQNFARPAFEERGLTLERLITSPRAGIAFMRSMPTTDVAITLKTAWHRNRDKQWASNDVYDIDAMALAVPYCDIVVTEKACCHALIVAGTDRRMNTVVLRDLTRLPGVLMDWKAA